MIAAYERQLGRTLTAGERARVVKTAVLVTRPTKQHPEPAALHARWQAEAQTTGWTTQRLLRAVSQAARTLARPARPLAGTLARSGGALARAGDVTPSGPGADPVVGAVRAAGRRGSVFSRADVAGQTAAALVTAGLTAGEVLARVEQLTDQALRSAEAVPLGALPRGVTPRASDPRYASLEVLTRRPGSSPAPHRAAGTGTGRQHCHPGLSCHPRPDRHPRPDCHPRPGRCHP